LPIIANDLLARLSSSVLLKGFELPRRISMLSLIKII
jgi:hypothetical protein